MACHDEHDKDSASVSLVSHAYQRHTLVVIPAEGYTATAIADLINNGRTVIDADKITTWFDSPDGVVIATVASAEEDNKEPAWAVAQSCGCGQQLTPAELDQRRASGLVNHAGDYIGKGDFVMAESCLALARQMIDRSGTWEHTFAIELLTQEAILLENTGRKAEAFPHITLAAEIARRVCSPDDTQLAMAECNYGELLLEVGRTAEAQSVLAGALKSLEAQAASTPEPNPWIEQLIGSARTMHAQATAALLPAKKTRTRRRSTRRSA